MAIWIGKWHDPQGVPFDPGAIGRRGSGDSHQAQTQTRQHDNPILHNSWHWILPQLVDRWFNILTPQNRAAWLWWSDWHIAPRDYVASVANKAFVTFASANWPMLYGLGGYWRDQPIPQCLFIHSIFFTIAQSTTQTITVEVTYTDWPRPENPGATYFFQVDPARLKSKRHHRFTRALGGLWLWDQTENPLYTFSAKATFPFVAGDLIQIIYRHNYGASWDYTWHLNKVAI